MTRVRLAIRDVGPQGGIGRYVTELVGGLPAVEGIEVHPVVIGRAISDWAIGMPNVDVPRMPLGGSLALLRLPRRSDEVTHFPLHETTPVFAALGGPIVMTIHSVEPTYMLRSELSDADDSKVSTLPFHVLRLVRRRIARVVTPSAYERDRIVENLGFEPDRVDVIPHGVDHDVFSPGDRAEAAELVKARWGIVGPYVLYVGHHQPQKNVERLIAAFRSLRRDDVTLAIAGNTNRCAARYERASRGAANVNYLGEVTDDYDLARLYRAARVFCFPSLHESFGLPALEAMACGCPVVAARGSGLEQTVGDAALLFDPRSVDELAAQLASILHEDSMGRRLGGAGIARAASFTWDECVRAHAATYRKAAA
jgi:glycosyltransferase involved in cell wall biosynthesis